MNLKETQKVLKSLNEKYWKEKENNRNKNWLVRTKNGHRLIFNNFNSIQWALTERIEDLI